MRRGAWPDARPRALAGALTVRLLAQLAAERGFDEWRRAFAGEAISTSERRAATHIALGRRCSRCGREKSWHCRNPSEKKALPPDHQRAPAADLRPRLLADGFGDGELDVRFVANVDAVELKRGWPARRKQHPGRRRFKTFSRRNPENANTLHGLGFKDFTRHRRPRRRNSARPKS
jgi:hypothetical protein